jgi:hypothetical protein
VSKTLGRRNIGLTARAPTFGGPYDMTVIVMISTLAVLICACHSPRQEATTDGSASSSRWTPNARSSRAAVDTSLAYRRQVFERLIANLAYDTATTAIERAPRATFPTHWTHLMMTDTSFIVYDPCDGDNSTISLHGDSITIGYLWEPQSFRIDSIETGTSTLIHGSTPWCDSPEEGLTMNVTVLEESTGLSRWEWSWNACGWTEDRAWLMVPTVNAHRFPRIVHPCRESKELEFEFLEPPF